VLRIFREALTNVVKHARAQRVDVQVEVQGERLSLVIRDDGQVPAEAQPRRGLDTGRGMANMRARAREVGGELTVSTGEGLSLKLEVPLPRFSPAAGDAARA
jgi:signal transduction histidine kinase